MGCTFYTACSLLFSFRSHQFSTPRSAKLRTGASKMAAVSLERFCSVNWAEGRWTNYSLSKRRRSHVVFGSPIFTLSARTALKYAFSHCCRIWEARKGSTQDWTHINFYHFFFNVDVAARDAAFFAYTLYTKAVLNVSWGGLLHEKKRKRLYIEIYTSRWHTQKK